MIQRVTAGLAVRRAIAAAMVVLVTGFTMSMPARADAMSDWRHKLVQKIGHAHIYPRAAIAREIEGVAKVKVTIDRDGKITNYEVVEATGQSVLDNVIPKIMKKLDPLPKPPASLSDANLTFVIPFAWRLR
ncbi:energy transducer TonB [Kordiimonas marina]|uniref:energy transducer TonB n=1 Tax=Kordiimonas marina TaxID=2872312 RepID=UPI001FF61EC8|nr:TonB family protein [Kordiimonas marina]MCJ9428184.1 TonB family protein [Kordiimonas marina]